MTYQLLAKETRPALPAYIHTRNADALAAGLVIERLEVSDGALTTWYRGAEEEWRRVKFCRRSPDKPFPKNFNGADFICFSPANDSGRGYIKVRPMKSGDYRGAIANEPLPGVVEQLPENITEYSFKGKVAYVGCPEALVRTRIAPEEILIRRTWGRDGDYYGHAPGMDAWQMGPLIWRASYLDDGLCIFTDHVGVREDQAAKAADRKREPFNSPEDLRQQWCQMVRLALSQVESSYRRVDTKSGRTYSVDESALGSVRRAVDDLVTAIGAVRIKVRDTDPTAWETRRLAAVAQADSNFQGFLSGVGLRN